MRRRRALKYLIFQEQAYKESIYLQFNKIYWWLLYLVIAVYIIKYSFRVFRAILNSEYVKQIKNKINQLIYENENNTETIGIILQNEEEINLIQNEQEIDAKDTLKVHFDENAKENYLIQYDDVTSIHKVTKVFFLKENKPNDSIPDEVENFPIQIRNTPLIEETKSTHDETKNIHNIDVTYSKKLTKFSSVEAIENTQNIIHRKNIEKIPFDPKLKQDERCYTRLYYDGCNGSSKVVSVLDHSSNISENVEKNIIK